MAGEGAAAPPVGSESQPDPDPGFAFAQADRLIGAAAAAGSVGQADAIAFSEAYKQAVTPADAVATLVITERPTIRSSWWFRTRRERRCRPVDPGSSVGAPLR